MICNVLIFGVQQSVSVIYIHMYIFILFMGFSRAHGVPILGM